MNLMHTIKNLHTVNEDIAIQKEIDEAQQYHQNLIKKAIQIAKKSSGNFDKAWASIDKLKKGLADFPMVAKALKTANEDVEQNSDLDSLFEEALDEASNPLSKRWVSAKGNLTVGKIELKRGKGGKSHTIKRNGKVIGDFSLDTDDDMWVANVKGERGQLVARDIDELVKRLEQLKESVDLDLDALFEEELREDYFTVQYYNGNGSLVDDKFKNFKTKAEADKYAKRGNSIDRVGGKYKTFKVKGRMESVEVVETIKKGDVFTKKEALAYFKNERKDFKPSELKKFKNKGGKVVNHWQDGETGEVLPMKESIDESIESDIKSALKGRKDKVLSVDQWHEILYNTSDKMWSKDKIKASMKKLKVKIKEEVEEAVSVELDEAKERGFIAVHAKKGKLEVKAKTTYDAAKKAADKWKLKSTSGIDVHLAEEHELEENCGIDHSTLKGDEKKKHMKDVHPSVNEVRSPANVSLEKSGGYEVYASGKKASGVMYFLSYKNKIISSGSKKDGKFIFGFKHKDIHPNSRYKPAGMVKKGKDFTHMGFKSPKEIIAFSKNLGITEDIKLDELHR